MGRRSKFRKMAENIKISQSRVKLARRCWYAHWLRYVEKLKRRGVKRPLDFGSLVHKMKEYEAEGKNPNQALDEAEEELKSSFSGERVIYAEIIDDVDVIMSEYFEYWEDNEPEIEYVEIDGKFAEHWIEIEIADNTIMTGKIDSLVTTVNNKRWLVDIKTHGKALPSHEDRWMNLQTSVYFKAIELMGWGPVEGIMWDYIYSKKPTVPKILKSGKLSKQKIVTLPSVVESFAEEEDIALEDYEEMLDIALDSRNDYFERIFTSLNETIINSVFDDFLETAKQIKEMGETCKVKTIDLHCSWCDYKQICHAEMSGGDTDKIKERMYTNASQREKKKEAKKTNGKKKVSRSGSTRRTPSKTSK